MSKILVTGGTGQVGRHLQDFLPNATFVSSSDCDLRSESDTSALFSRGWDHVIHLAARVGGILDNISHQADFIEDNLLMNTLVLKYARLNDIPRFTAILSTCIYPDVATAYPMSEETLHDGPPQATNFAYAVAKRAMAAQIEAYRRQYGLRYNYLIPCNLYGPYDRYDETKSHFLTAFLGNVADAERNGLKSIKLLGTGKPLRQFLYAGDLARLLALCAEGGVTESFNVAVDENISIREAAEQTLKALGMDDIEIVFDGTSPDGQFRKDVSIAKMRSLFPEFEFTPLATGVRLVYEKFKQEPK